MESVARTGRGGWQENEIMQLREAVRRAGGNGEPLRGVFEQIGASLGRKPNSVRNYYYACLKREEAGSVPHAAPFQTFSQEEVRQLMHDVLAARAQGVSVRACVQRMARGNRKDMLRYQNKYRSVLKTRPALVRQIIDEMRENGEPTFDPYAVQSTQAQPLHDSIAIRAEASGDPALLGLLRGLDALLSRANLLDPSPLRGACQPLVTAAKDFLGLPDEERFQALPAFCEALREHVGAVEAAME